MKKTFFLIIIFCFLLGFMFSCGGNSSNESDNSDDSTQNSNDSLPENNMYIYISGNRLEVTLEDNSSVKALIAILQEKDIVYTARDYGGFEKVGSLGYNLPTNHSQQQAQSGDVMLYQNDQLVIFYGSNTWSYTKIGKITSTEDVNKLLNNGESYTEIRLSLY